MNTNSAPYISNRSLHVQQNTATSTRPPERSGSNDDVTIAVNPPMAMPGRPALPPVAPPAPWRIPRPTVPGTPQQWADALWYLGHVMGAGSLLGHVNLPAAAVLVIAGQAMVIVSRPLGRIPARAPHPAADDMV